MPGKVHNAQGWAKISEADKEAMDLWKQAEKTSGLRLREIYWDGDANAQADTRAAQPAITVFNLNLWRKFRDKLAVFACAGHSLGEFSALAASGILSPVEAIEITALRGKLMAEADPENKGAMAAIVRLPVSEVLDLVSETSRETGQLVVAANFNTPSQTVISGEKEAVERACQKAKAARGRSVPLKVSGAFHSPMMEEANREFLPWLERLDWKAPRLRFYANAEGSKISSGEEAERAMSKQMVSPVQWTGLVRNLYRDGGRRWLEIGPTPVLAKMVAPNLAEAGDPGLIEALNSFQQGITRIQVK